MESFADTLARHDLALVRGTATTLQVNVGRLCNQVCRHCHLDAGPGRREIMSRRTMEDVVAYAERCSFETIDVTGGAPEMVPGIEDLLRSLSRRCRRLMLRSNLTAIAEEGRERLVECCRELKVSVVASFPSTSSGQADAQRGEGTWETSIATLRMLNGQGFGVEGTGLRLDLVVNPSGAFLPADQCQLEKKFRRDLARRWGVSFSRLFSFANAPLGRYRTWLEKSGNYDQYMARLTGSFNPSTIPGLMCRTLVSVSWDGTLFDCDFNLAAGLALAPGRQSVRDLKGPPLPGSAIAVGEHCFACTAGAGFT